MAQSTRAPSSSNACSRSAFTGKSLHLYGLYGTNPSDVRVFGELEDQFQDRGVICKYDGGRWTPEKITGAALRDGWYYTTAPPKPGAQPADYGWAVGLGALWQLENNVWTDVTRTSGIHGNLYGISGARDGDVWAVGTTIWVYIPETKKWTQVTSGIPNDGALARDVWSESVSSAYVTKGAHLLHCVATTAAAGCTDQNIPSFRPLAGIWGTSPTQITIGGYAGRAKTPNGLYEDDGGWHALPPTKDGYGELTSVWRAKIGDVAYFTGSALSLAADGVLPFYPARAEWGPVMPTTRDGTPEVPEDIWGLTDEYLLVTGYDGDIWDCHTKVCKIQNT